MSRCTTFVIHYIPLCYRFRENEGPDDASFFFIEVIITDNVIYLCKSVSKLYHFLAITLSIDNGLCGIIQNIIL